MQRRDGGVAHLDKVLEVAVAKYDVPRDCVVALVVVLDDLDALAQRRAIFDDGRGMDSLHDAAHRSRTIAAMSASATIARVPTLATPSRDITTVCSRSELARSRPRP